MSSDVQIARAEVLRSAVWARVIVCVTIAIGGMLCLAAGIGMVVVGLSNDQAFSCVSEAQKVKVAGIGAISMVASAVWAYFSRKTSLSASKTRTLREPSRIILARPLLATRTRAMMLVNVGLSPSPLARSSTPTGLPRPASPSMSDR